MNAPKTPLVGLTFVVVLGLLVGAKTKGDESPPIPPLDAATIEHMRQVHARFDGRKGTLALFGDSITVSLAFWAPLAYECRNMPPEMERAVHIVKSYMLPECWRDWRGPEFGNEGRTTIRWAFENIDGWLTRLRPETAVIMFGTNDLNDLDEQEYREKLRAVVEKCLNRGTIVILTTIPPRHGRAEKAVRFAQIAREVAEQLKVPLIDYHAEILKRRPEDWDGADEKFQGYETYEVPTLISRDGVHPSNPKSMMGDFSEEALRTSGFGLRNYLTVLRYAEVIEKVLQVPQE
ncbi:MAG TPA: SGNH/GDSL hydrolase family protein [Thermogutta sp.]|nr:SGNH/GDSL hydrolase family protein [Thermogutta sp.]